MQIRHEGIEAAVDSYMPGEEIQEPQTHTNYATDTTSATFVSFPRNPTQPRFQLEAHNTSSSAQYKCLQVQPSELELQPPNFFIRQFVEVERECETGFGDHPSGSEVARVTVSLNHCPNFGRARV